MLKVLNTAPNWRVKYFTVHTQHAGSQLASGPQIHFCSLCAPVTKSWKRPFSLAIDLCSSTWCLLGRLCCVHLGTGRQGFPHCVSVDFISKPFPSEGSPTAPVASNWLQKATKLLKQGHRPYSFSSYSWPVTHFGCSRPAFCMEFIFIP